MVGSFIEFVAVAAATQVASVLPALAETILLAALKALYDVFIITPSGA